MTWAAVLMVTCFIGAGICFAWPQQWPKKPKNIIRRRRYFRDG